MWKVHITSTIAYFKTTDQGGERTWSNLEMWRCGGSTLHPHCSTKHPHSSTIFHITSTKHPHSSTMFHIHPHCSTKHPHSSTMFYKTSTFLHNLVCCLAHRGSTVGFPLLQCSSGVVRHPRDLQVWVATRFCRVLIFASS